MKYIITALLSAALIWLVPTGTPGNLKNSETKAAAGVVTTTNGTPGQSASLLTDKTTVEVSNIPTAAPGTKQEKPESQPEPVAIPEPPTTEEDAKAFIYQNESGNRPWAKNSIGCYGLGQDCNGIVKSKCGADYSCQDTFFTNYMLRRYKTWTAAKSFWLARVPINGQDVGNWW